MKQEMTNVTALPVRSTAGLDLENLPDRLDNTQIEQLRAITREPLPDLPPVDRDFLRKTLRMMLSTLPRRQSDDLSGELFVEAYERQLCGYPHWQIEALCDHSIGSCRWFPTVAECHEICGQYRRNDEAVNRRNLAYSAIYREEQMRRTEKPAEDAWRPTKEEIAQVHREAAERLRSTGRD